MKRKRVVSGARCYCWDWLDMVAKTEEDVPDLIGAPGTLLLLEEKTVELSGLRSAMLHIGSLHNMGFRNIDRRTGVLISEYIFKNLWSWGVPTFFTTSAVIVRPQSGPEKFRVDDVNGIVLSWCEALEIGSSGHIFGSAFQCGTWLRALM